jgi:hypothetical protein
VDGRVQTQVVNGESGLFTFGVTESPLLRSRRLRCGFRDFDQSRMYGTFNTHFFFKYIKEAVVELKLVRFFDYPRNSLR